MDGILQRVLAWETVVDAVVGDYTESVGIGFMPNPALLVILCSRESYAVLRWTCMPIMSIKVAIVLVSVPTLRAVIYRESVL